MGVIANAALLCCPRCARMTPLKGDVIVPVGRHHPRPENRRRDATDWDWD